MRGRLGFIVLVIFGSFCVYCAQNVVGSGSGGNRNGGGGGMVGNANGDTCCTPPDPPSGSVLFDNTFTDCASPTIDVAGNRTIVAHGSFYGASVEWSFGGAAGWVSQTIPTNSDEVLVLDGRLGKQLRFAWGTSCQPKTSLTVVGYKQ
ncbi:MAG TPA: hypothetical protein VF334_06035 [Polyangia bacterium]